MRLNDAAAGVLITALGTAVAALSRTFPPMPGQSVGPALFPTLIGLGLIVLGALLAGAQVRRPRAAWIVFDEWVGASAAVIKFVLVIVALVFYVSALDRLGFFITGFVFLAVLCLAFGVRRRTIVPLSIIALFAMHYAFYSLLRVPLPWGVLERIAW